MGFESILKNIGRVTAASQDYAFKALGIETQGWLGNRGFDAAANFVERKFAPRMNSAAIGLSKSGTDGVMLGNSSLGGYFRDTASKFKEASNFGILGKGVNGTRDFLFNTKPLETGMWNKTKSISSTLFNLMDSNSVGKRALWGAAIGGLGGAAVGMAGNILAPNLGNTDPHFVKNAILTGAAAGALGIASGAAGNFSKAAALNKNITPGMINIANKVQRWTDSKAVMGAVAAASWMGQVDTHFTQALNRNNSI